MAEKKSDKSDKTTDGKLGARIQLGAPKLNALALGTFGGIFNVSKQENRNVFTLKDRNTGNVTEFGAPKSVSRALSKMLERGPKDMNVRVTALDPSKPNVPANQSMEFFDPA